MKKMKKYYLAFLCIVLSMFALVGCGETEKNVGQISYNDATEKNVEE